MFIYDITTKKHYTTRFPK